MTMAMASHGLRRVLRRQQRRTRSLFAVLRVWRQRARGRRELFMMNDRELRDIGLRRLDVLRETAKPFWRA